ncbi:MAG TPA: hypothetical protein VFB90_08875 [Dehalococcoidia bacterium]|nr:hypothetical protein [Dehalococcoidia bacterium]
MLRWALALLGLSAVLLAAACSSTSEAPSNSGNTADDIPCEAGERLTYHVHVHLAIFLEGQPVTVPAGTGIRSNCIFWLHTHDTTGIIHVEAPSQRSFSLGQLFAIWGQPLSSTQLLSKTVDSQHQIKAYVNGQEFTGDPSTIPLTAHAVIVLEYGPPFPAPQPFTFPAGL